MERKGGKRRRDRAGKTERETRVEGGNLQGWKVQRKGKSFSPPSKGQPVRPFFLCTNIDDVEYAQKDTK